MKTFGELKPGDNIYQINHNKVKIIKISSVCSDDTFSYIVTYENRDNNHIYRKDSYVYRRTFSCKEALNDHILKEIKKLQNRIVKLNHALL